ncbi:MAG: 50S ribosomal protein L31e [archaeon]|jgi:large subunit ribosomal protein L31e|nr:50S ribosomal protein L31e [archaeon]
MAEKNLVREYVVPLRREFLKVPQYRRAGKAARALKIFIAKHMKVPERDVEKVKLDVYLNNEIWARGIKNPPSKIKVRATKEGDIVKVELVELPAYLKFLKAKHERRHKAEEKKPESKLEKTAEEAKEEKTEEQKKDESEKEKAGEVEKLKEAKKDKHVQKHTGKDKNVEIRRRSMDRH